MPDNVIHELQQPLTLINVSDVTEEEHQKVRNSVTTATSTSCRGWPLAQALHTQLRPWLELAPLALELSSLPLSHLAKRGRTAMGAF